MTRNPHAHVAGFAVAGDPAAPVVCVRVEAGDGLGVWIGRSGPGDEPYVIEHPQSLRESTLDQVRAIIESWPDKGHPPADVIQSMAWLGRRELIPARLRALVSPPPRPR